MLYRWISVDIQSKLKYSLVNSINKYSKYKIKPTKFTWNSLWEKGTFAFQLRKLTILRWMMMDNMKKSTTKWSISIKKLVELRKFSKLMDQVCIKLNGITPTRGCDQKSCNIVLIFFHKERVSVLSLVIKNLERSKNSFRNIKISKVLLHHNEVAKTT